MVIKYVVRSQVCQCLVYNLPVTMDSKLPIPRQRIVCVLLTVCMAVPNTKSELESVAVNGVSHYGTSPQKEVQTTSISLDYRARSNNFISNGNFFQDLVTMTYNKQEQYNSSGSDIYGRTSGLTNCKFCGKLLSCVKLALLFNVAETLRIINEKHRLSQSFEAFNGLVSSERNTGSELGAFYKWHESDISEGRTLHMLLVSGITELFQNRSLTFTFVPGIIVNVLTKKMGPGLVNLSVKLVHGGEKDGNHFVETDGRKLLEVQPWMLIPGAVMVGLFPYLLLHLKMLVTSAMMFNNMVLLGAVLMTLRNLVFGNRPGGVIVYDNLGYEKEPPLPHHPGLRQPAKHGSTSEAYKGLPVTSQAPRVPHKLAPAQ